MLSSENEAGGSYICMPCCRGRSYEDSIDEVDRLDMSDRGVVVPVQTVQQEPAFNAQPSKIGQMNPNLANTEVMPTR
jgi:hypothetical protein